MQSQLSDIDLEWHLLYSIIVAGKSAKFTNRIIKILKGYVPTGKSPLRYLLAHQQYLFKAKTGRYRVLKQALADLHRLRLDLRTCTPDELEHVHGIGPKSARFFIMWMRPESRFAVLDRHILRWLKSRGYEAPDSTPPASKYYELEKVFIHEADQIGMTPRELDLDIWRAAATADNIV